MDKKALLAISLLASLASAAPVHLRCEHLENPLGIDIVAPRLSWRMETSERNWMQSAYQILVASGSEKLIAGTADVWDSGRQASSDSVGVPYAGAALESRKRYYWRVRVWDAAGKMSESEAAWFEMGLLKPSDWEEAQWIRWQNPDDAADREQVRWIWARGEDAFRVAPNTRIQFRTSLGLSRIPANAAIFATAKGDYKIRVNGVAAGGKNAWMLFDRQEIGTLLKPGRNVIEVEMTVPPRPQYGVGAGDPKSPREAAFAALVKLTYPDGTIERTPTAGGMWEARLEPNGEWQKAVAVGTLDEQHFSPDPGPFPQPAALLRRGFSILKPVKAARAYVTALGSYRLFLNGKRVGDDVLTPDFVDYSKRVPYQTYDVTSMLIANGATNVAAAMLGDGWFASGMSWNGQHFPLLPPTRFRALIAIDYADGSHDSIATDTMWKTAASPILHSEIYWGEVYDARLDIPGWNTAKFDDFKWAPAVKADGTPGVVSAQMTAPARVVMTQKPAAVKEQSPGVYIYDMGQNMVGWAAIQASGKAGTTIRMRFAEILSPDGSIYRENLRNADATDFFTLRGSGVETFEPHFTFHASAMSK